MSDTITVVALGVYHLSNITTTFAAQKYFFLLLGGCATFTDHPVSLDDVGFVALITFSRLGQWLILLVIDFPLDLFHASLAKMVEWCYQDGLIFIGHTLLMLVLVRELILVGLC